ncbi:MAG: dihydrodipicolinate synthase family protein [Gemmatimonadetes bacterium]|nr:dihydrodipicolinate synthase family protein [Gemmatimonadota bacterium]
MQKSDWRGVFPAITTPFRADGSVDEAFLAEHVDWLVRSGCRGIVALGSLGEGATLREAEKVRILEVCRGAIRGRVPLVAAISGLATQACVELARAAEAIGCDGLMVLPAYVYRGDWRETEAHFSAIIEATSLSCMLYNNPIAYGTDLSVRDIEELAARHENVHAVKDSSGDVRRLTALRERLGARLALFAGLDDMVTEATLMGGDGWIAGLANAFPEESVRLFELAHSGNAEEARRLYEWFLPLLRFDTLPKFVQLIKLVQAEVGRGNEAVRAPRLPLSQTERAEALAVIRERIALLGRTAAIASA